MSYSNLEKDSKYFAGQDGESLVPQDITIGEKFDLGYEQRSLRGGYRARENSRERIMETMATQARSDGDEKRATDIENESTRLSGKEVRDEFGFQSLFNVSLASRAANAYGYLREYFDPTEEDKVITPIEQEYVNKANDEILLMDKEIQKIDGFFNNLAIAAGGMGKELTHPAILATIPMSLYTSTGKAAVGATTGQFIRSNAFYTLTREMGLAAVSDLYIQTQEYKYSQYLADEERGIKAMTLGDVAANVAINSLFAGVLTSSGSVALDYSKIARKGKPSFLKQENIAAFNRTKFDTGIDEKALMKLLKDTTFDGEVDVSVVAEIKKYIDSSPSANIDQHTATLAKARADIDSKGYVDIENDDITTLVQEAVSGDHIGIRDADGNSYIGKVLNHTDKDVTIQYGDKAVKINREDGQGVGEDIYSAQPDPITTPRPEARNINDVNMDEPTQEITPKEQDQMMETYKDDIDVVEAVKEVEQDDMFFKQFDEVAPETIPKNESVDLTPIDKERQAKISAIEIVEGTKAVKAKKLKTLSEMKKPKQFDDFNLDDLLDKLIFGEKGIKFKTTPTEAGKIKKYGITNKNKKEVNRLSEDMRTLEEYYESKLKVADEVTNFPEEVTNFPEEVTPEVKAIRDTTNKDLINNDNFQELETYVKNPPKKESTRESNPEFSLRMEKLLTSDGEDAVNVEWRERMQSGIDSTDVGYEIPQLSKKQLKAIKDGSATPDDYIQLREDLELLQSYRQEVPETITITKDDFGNEIWAKGGTELFGGSVAGIEQDEDGNITIDPVAFVIGMVLGHTAKRLALNPKVQKGTIKALEKYALKLAKDNPALFDLNPKLYAGESARGFKEAQTAGKTTSDIADKQEKFWIDDIGATFNEKKLVDAMSGEYVKFTYLDEVLKHDKLYKEYPELKDLKIQYDESINGAVYDGNMIKISPNNTIENIKSSILHETQHAIQKTEGFAKGGSPENLKAQDLYNTLQEKLGDLPYFQKKEKEFLSGEITEEEFFTEVINTGAGSYEGGVKELRHGTYQRLAGEQEARAVQAKLKNPELDPYAALAKEEGGLKEPIIQMENQGIARSEDMDKKLIATHNLTQENLKFAEKKGGIIVPSIAVTRANEILDGFGEITLIGDKTTVTPSIDTKSFAADIYSPRYPKIYHNTTISQDSAMQKELEKYYSQVGETRDLPIDGITELYDNTAFKAKFLESKGIKPKTVKAPGINKVSMTQYNKYYKEFMNIKSKDFVDKQMMQYDPKFQAAVLKELEEVDPSILKALDVGEPLGVDASKELKRLTYRRASQLDALKKADQMKGKIDSEATRIEIRNQINKKKLGSQLKEYAQSYLDKHGVEDKLYAGTDSMGRPKYKPHTVDNVLKIMKKDIRGGEGTFYGTGSIRAKLTPEFKTLKQIQESVDRLVSTEKFDAAKEEISKVYDEVTQDLKQFYKWDENNFGFQEEVGYMLADGATPQALREYGFEKVSDEVLTKINDLVKAMRVMPTEYFETKILRQVDAGEFKAAVVPNGTSKETIDMLKKKGLKVTKYNSGVDGARKEAISKAATKGKLLFLHPIAGVAAVTAAALTMQEAKNYKEEL